MFKDKIKEYRLNSNMSREAVAEKLNVSIITVLKWESGKKLPSNDVLDDICFLFNIVESDLLDEKELNKVYKKAKMKRIVSKLFLRTFYILLGLGLLSLTIASLYDFFEDINNKLNPKPIYNIVDRYYTGEYIALELNEEFEVNIEELNIEDNMKYDKMYFNESKYFTYKKNTITPVKEGVFTISCYLENKKENTIHVLNIYKVFCYDVNNFIEINDVKDLCDMNKNKSGHYILNANLDLKDIENFEPIGQFTKEAFTGIFINPKGYKISNLTIKDANKIYDTTSGACGAGLFGSVKNAYIDNIILENVYIDASNFNGQRWSDAGGLASIMSDSLVTNCKVSGTVIGQLYVGGIVANVGSSTMKNNTFIGNVIQKNGELGQRPSAGGIAGWLYCCDDKDTIRGCEITGNVVAAKITSELIAGKIAGFIHGDLIYNNMVYCELEAPEEYDTGKGIKWYD